jgi:hypothetical protein
VRVLIFYLLILVTGFQSALAEPQEQPFEPQKICRVCDELAQPGTCRCYDFVTQKMAERLYSNIEVTLAEVSSGQIRLKRPVQVKVVSSFELEKMGGEYLLGLYEDDVIWLSFELDRRRALAVLAHEFGHAWFFQHRTDARTVPDLLYEGFPEFLSYLVLREAGDHEACYSISTVDQSVYGRGARRLIGLYYRAGLEPVLQLALTGSDIEAMSDQAY